MLGPGVTRSGHSEDALSLWVPGGVRTRATLMHDPKLDYWNGLELDYWEQ